MSRKEKQKSPKQDEKRVQANQHDSQQQHLQLVQLQTKPPPPAVNNRDEIEHTLRMMEMTLENDTDFGYCGDGAEEALDNAWLSLAEKVQTCRKIRGLECVTRSLARIHAT